MALLQFASYSGAIELYMPAIRAVSGIAVTIIDTITSPSVAIMLALFSGLYLWAVSYSSATSGDRHISAVIFWVLLWLCMVPICSILLFGILVTV